VSATPYFTAAATSGNTYNGITYSKTLAVSFGGNATVSLGWNPTLGVNFGHTLGGVFYKIDNGVWVKAAASNSPTFLWHAINVVFTQGLHTITFNATDSQGDVSAPVTLQVLVDTSTPTVHFISGQSAVSVGTPIQFSVTDSEGDLNMTAGGVWATSNSTATLTTAITTGTNNPGNPVTYNVTVTGLPATQGHWSLTLHAYNLAGTVATLTEVVKVTVAYADSMSVTTPALATIGSFTGIQATVTNGWTSSQSVIMFAVFTSVTTGDVACVATGSATLASGASQSVFAPCASLPSGTYSVAIFVITTGNNPVSSKTTISVTV